MASTKTKDQIVQELQEQVKQKKALIAKIKRPDWKTTCSYKETPNAMSTNIHVVNDPNVLIGIMASLTTKEESMEKAAKALGVEKYTYKHDGFSVNDWVEDLKLRMAKINIATEESKLNEIEKRLAKLESPELKEQRELLELMKLMED
jgi:hypothetical protein